MLDLSSTNTYYITSAALSLGKPHSAPTPRDHLFSLTFVQLPHSSPVLGLARGFPPSFYTFGKMIWRLSFAFFQCVNTPHIFRTSHTNFIRNYKQAI